VKHIAGDVADQARKSAGMQLSGEKDRAADGLGSVADALRQTGEHLGTQEKTGLHEYVVRAADQVEAASGCLKSRTPVQILGDVESLARREPALFLGGAFVVGLIGGRFLKSSCPNQAIVNGDPKAQGKQDGRPRSPMQLDHGNQSNKALHSDGAGQPKPGPSSSTNMPSAAPSDGSKTNGANAEKIPGVL